MKIRNKLPPAVYHGAFDYAELENLGINPDTILDFSVNSNPFGASPAVREALASVAVERYPDRESLALRRTLADRLNLSPENIVTGNGTAELICLAVCALFQAGDKFLIAGPTFGEYERVACQVGASVYRLNAQPSDGFRLNQEEFSGELDRIKWQGVFICNPNNPTGQSLPAEVISSWAGAHPETCFIVDEAYLSFVPGMKSALCYRRNNILVLRSMTKDFALAGLRLGYAAGEESLIRSIAGWRPAWNVNAFAQAAGLAALLDEPYYRKTLSRLQSEKEFLVQGLIQIRYDPIPASTHFFLLPVTNGQDFRARLLRHGIMVRDCASFGLPDYVRISPRTHVENNRLLSVLSTMIGYV